MSTQNESARERGDQVPTIISTHAWDAAFAIDGAVESLLADCGVLRKTEQAYSISALAKIVQLSINRSHDHG